MRVCVRLKLQVVGGSAKNAYSELNDSFLLLIAFDTIYEYTIDIVFCTCGISLFARVAYKVLLLFCFIHTLRARVVGYNKKENA